ncbi:MAG: electron transport complex subunit RsxC [FCB group bacterium]|nr:electron transport complex subunit RsxC [FCB group bacterium]
MRLSTFKKGVHPGNYKHFTSLKVIEKLPLPNDVFIPLQQHIGAPNTALVKKGDQVRTGQIIGSTSARVSSPVHATITGIVKDVAPFRHPIGGKAQMIHIRRTGDEDEWDLLPAFTDWQARSAEELNLRIHEAGIVGLGGAAFPTHVKLAPPKDKPIDSFILNGCECEPYLTADHRAMVEMTDKVLTGMSIIMKILGVQQGYIGIENNKLDAIDVMRDAIRRAGLDFIVVPLQTKYPQGAEKMLIQAILRRQVPVGGLPMDVGTVVNNIGTAIAVAEAVTEGKPLVQRIVTVTGDGIREPRNVLARIGTPFKQALEYCGGTNADTAQVFMGGPMMGIAQFDLNVPIIKATSGIICTKQAIRNTVQSGPCIRCGSCVRVCPMFLLPTRLTRLSEKGYWDDAEKSGILNCVECGSCAFICPSHIPLVQWIRVGKLRVNERKRKKAA